VSGSDTRWKTGPTGGPRLAVARGAGPPCQRLLRRGGACGAGCSVWATKWAALALAGARKRKGEGGKAGREGGGKKWAELETERGRGNLFPFYFSSFYSNPFEKNL